MLSNTFPDFRLSLLSLLDGDTDQRPRVVVLLSQVIMDDLNPEVSHGFCDLLSSEVFALLETLIWGVPQDLLDK